MKKRYLIPTIAAFGLILCSCGKKNGAVDTGADKDKLKPNEAVENWAIDMRDGRVASLWDSMPEQYQKDVEGLVHSFGSKVDAEVYNELMKTLGSASGLMKSKKDLVLKMADENSEDIGTDKIASVKTNYDAFVGLMDSIMKSQIKDTEGLKTLVIADFMGEIQPNCKDVSAAIRTLAADAKDTEWFNSPKSKLISESGSSAEVSDPESPEETIKLTQVGNRWVPADMADEWKDVMSKASKGLETMETMDEAQKQQFLGILRTAQAVIKDLDTAKTTEELQEKFMKAAEQFGGF
jgi:hypothetical protein